MIAEEKEALSVQIPQDLKRELESEATQLKYSLSKYIEVILKHRNVKETMERMINEVLPNE